jgi:class 3 adenylate cyclase
VRRCERCGRENADDARFCQGCGAALGEAPSPDDPSPEEREERKVVSALFVDVVGSTARADGADPEDVRDELRTFYEAVRVLAADR